MDKPNRKLNRLPDFDYSQPLYYYVTVCTAEKRKLFGEPLKLNAFGKAAELAIQNIPNHFPTIRVDKYVVMPNHIHMILVFEPFAVQSCSLSTIVGCLKAAISREIRPHYPDMAVWQRSFYDHVIRNQQDYEAIWLYIEDNPRKWIENNHE